MDHTVVAASLVAVVALFSRFQDSVAADLSWTRITFLALGGLAELTTAAEVLLHKTELRAAVARDCVAVVAGLADFDDIVAANWVLPVAVRTGSSALEPHVDFAVGRTTHTVLVIALLSCLDDAVAAEPAG